MNVYTRTVHNLRPMDCRHPMEDWKWSAACFWRLSAGMVVSELLFRVLARIAPDRVPPELGSIPTWQWTRF